MYLFGLIICAPSHVALSQSFVDGQQAGDLLDDDFPSQFDGTVAVVHAFPLGLKASGFLTDRQRQTGGGGRRPAQRRQNSSALIMDGTTAESVHTATLGLQEL